MVVIIIILQALNQSRVILLFIKEKRMTVSELIDKLKELPQDFNVMCVEQSCYRCAASVLTDVYLVVKDNCLVIGGDEGYL